MLFIFGVLSLKVLFGDAIENGNCDEFGHIHFYKAPGSTQTTNLVKSAKNHQDKNNENCHEGKSIFSYIPFPTSPYTFEISDYTEIITLTFSIENFFKSPTIEPHRKPPKYS